MATVAPAPALILQFLNNAGVPNVGGSILTQVGGVNYPTYQDAAGMTALPNPIPLNSRGEISNTSGVSSQLFLAQGVTYVFTLKDASGNTIWTANNVTAQGGQVGTLNDENGSDGTPGFKAGADFTAGTTQSLTLAGFYGSTANLWVAFDAGEQGANSFQLNGHTLTFGSYIGGTFTPAPIPVGTNAVFVKGGTTFSLGVPGAGTVTDATVAAGANINASKIGFLQSGAGAVNRTALSKMREQFSVTDFGAVGDGVTDNTAAINAALTAMGPGILVFPAGTFNTTGNHSVGAGQYVRGAGQLATSIALTAANDGFTLLTNDSGVSNLTMNGFTGATVGRLIAVTGQQGGPNVIENIQFATYNIGLQLFSTRTYVKNITAIGASNVNAQIISIIGGGDYFISTISSDNNPALEPAYGLLITACGGGWFEDMDLIHCTNGVAITPVGAGIVENLFFSRIAADTCSNNCWTVTTAGTAVIYGCTFDSCWGASAVNYGFFATGSGGVIDGLHFTNWRGLNNGLDGLIFQQNVTNVSMAGGMVSGNSQTSSGTSAGIHVGANVNGVSIAGMRVGPAQVFPDSQANQIQVDAGSGSNINISACDLHTPGHVPIVFNATGTNNSVSNCGGAQTKGFVSATTNGAGQLSITHQLGGIPKEVFITASNSGAVLAIQPTSFTSTTFLVTAWVGGTLAPNTAIQFSWEANF